jgi:hypothetical protein
MIRDGEFHMQNRRCAIFVLFLASAISATGCGKSTDLASIVALKGVVSDLERSLSATIAQADQAVDNEIKRAETSAKNVLGRIDKIVADGAKSVANERTEVAKAAFELIAETNKIVSSKQGEAFAQVNTSLASAASILDRVPFVDVPDTVFAITPNRLREETHDLQVSVYGYFPSIEDDAAAIAASVNGESVQVKRDVGKLHFVMPAGGLKKPLADVKIEFPKKGWFGGAPTPINTNIRILKAQPYQFTVEIRTVNPGAFVTVNGGPHGESTNNASRPHLEAERLFNLTAPNPERYESATAVITAVTTVSQGGGKPCSSCPDPNGRITGWNGAAIDLELNAPSCGGRMEGSCPFSCFWCGGGGSNYQVTVAAAFLVKVKGQPETNPGDVLKLAAGWDAVVKAPLPGNWASALIKASYDDNFEKRESVAVVVPQRPKAAGAMFGASVVENELLLSTLFTSAAPQEAGTRSADDRSPIEFWRYYAFTK